MNTTQWLTKYGVTGVAALLLSCSSFAQQEQRLQIKCHLQTGDQRDLIQQFVITDNNRQKFIDNLTDKTVFMADGRTKLQIVAVHECVDLNARFNSQAAIELEVKTPF